MLLNEAADAPLPSFVPTITANGDRFVAGGLPTELRHESDRMSAPVDREGRDLGG